MRRSLAAAGLLTAVVVGCHAPTHDLSAKFPEEYVVPPNEPRFDHPPESGYRRPPPKKDVAPGPGPGGAMAGQRGFGSGAPGQ